MTRSAQNGLSLLEITLSLVILSSVSVGALNLVEMSTASTKANAVGVEMAAFSRAVKAYTQDNYLAVAAVATDTTPALINTATLTAVTATNPTGTRYLPLGAALQNSYGQQYCALVLEPSANQLNTLVFTEGGTPINDIDLARVAGVISSAGISGGGIYAADPTQVRGASGAWSVSVSDFAVANNLGTHCDGTTAGVASLEAGHLAVGFWNNPQATPDALSRVAVAGVPAANQMNTAIDMRSNNVSNAGPIAAEALTGGTLSAGQTATFGDVQLTGVVLAGDPCAITGLMARTAAGALVSCQGGSWAVMEAPVSPYARVTFAPQGSWGGPGANIFTPSAATWVVPPNVKSIFVTMAAGGGTAQGWRITSNLMSGHSGGYLQSYPVSVTPGETLSITTGRSADFATIPTQFNTQYYAPECLFVGYLTIFSPPSTSVPYRKPAAYGPEGTGEFVGFQGHPTTISSNLRPKMLQCTGGSGAGPGRIGTTQTNYILANTKPVPSQNVHEYGFTDLGPGGSGTPGAVAVPLSYTDGDPSLLVPNSAGTCAAFDSASSTWEVVGKGSNGTGALFATGSIEGGQTPMVFGSGGGVVATNQLKVWTTPDTVGTCIQPLPAHDGIVWIDYAP